MRRGGLHSPAVALAIRSAPKIAARQSATGSRRSSSATPTMSGRWSLRAAHKGTLLERLLCQQPDSRRI